MATNKPTHIRKRNGAEVYVDRYEGNVLVVRNKKGKVLGSYGKDQQFTIKQFHERYEPKVVRR